jgi:malonyl-CoA/methylmalonyl-CoA synthetase
VPATNLYEHFRSRFPDESGAVFLETDGGRDLAYADVDAAAGRLQALLHDRGVTPGERVVAQVAKSPAAVLLYLACLRAGAIYVPLNTAYTAAEVGYVLADAAPRLLVCAPDRETELAALAGDAGGEVLTLDARGEGTLARSRALAPVAGVVPRAAADVAAILYTSGTTGRPKGAMLTHGNLGANAEVLHAAWRWRPGDVLLHALPIFHAHGLFVGLHCALLNGSRVMFVPRFDAARVTALLERATVFMGVPTHYTRLLEVAALDRERCRHMRLFLSGSAPLLAATHRAFEVRTGHRILERYGMTEAGMITSNPYDSERVAGTVGFALPGVAARVADAEGRELPRGETGVLEIRGPNVFAGYWRRPAETRAAFRADGFFVTGDLAVMGADGRVTLVGRATDLVITGGYNVYPREVEEVIDAVAGVRESAVIGVPHPDFGEAVTAVVVRDGSRPVDEATVLAALEGSLARFKHPKRVVFVEALPRNAMGKVLKGVLRDRLAAAPGAAPEA